VNISALVKKFLSKIRAIDKKNKNENIRTFPNVKRWIVNLQTEDWRKGIRKI